MYSCWPIGVRKPRKMIGRDHVFARQDQDEDERQNHRHQHERIQQGGRCATSVFVIIRHRDCL